jgi:hypothetical protein
VDSDKQLQDGREVTSDQTGNPLPDRIRRGHILLLLWSAKYVIVLQYPVAHCFN